MKGFDDKDEFWSLDDMLPPSAFEKKTVVTHSDVSSVEIEIDGSEQSANEPIPQRENNKYPPITSSGGSRIDFSAWLKQREKYVSEQKKNTRVIEIEYEPENPLIYKVKVEKDASSRRMNERFLSDGERLYELNGAFAGNVPFFAYFPQYASMSDEQRKCYIGFRSCVRDGVFPDVDEAYITLLVFEIINLTEKASAEKRASMLASLICAYTSVSEKLFSDMCNYLADMCIIYRTPIPQSVFGEVYSKVLKCVRLKELFIKGNGRVSEAHALLASASRYDFRTSKFYEENKENH